MTPFAVLSRDWHGRLSSLIRSAKRELLISSPFVTRYGTDFVLQHLSRNFRKTGTLHILTNLSPVNVCQGSTDPTALQYLSAGTANCMLTHLPRLHAKVYISDTYRAIVSSANLTLGGLLGNYEYGVEVSDQPMRRAIREDIVAYSDLGVRISEARLSKYCDIADQVKETYRTTQALATRSAQRRFALALRNAEDELIRLRLADGAMHTVFEKTIVYLLREHGPLRTTEMHPLIQAIHPELCDDGVDRVIDGKRFGKKWKHAVRTAQQQLKKKRLIQLEGTRWKNTNESNTKERKNDSS